MDASKTCATCDAFAAIEKQCRAAPPVVIMVLDLSGKQGVNRAWPPVIATEWCAAWRPEEVQQH